jgi:hypothetical protein
MMLGWAIGQIDRERKGGGGGGKPRIRLGKTGPRGRMYAPTKGTVAIAKSKFIKAGKGSRPAIREHLRYIQERERGEREPERDFFNRNRDGIERKDVFEDMMRNRGDRAAMHTLILSPGDNSIDIRDYTRESMEALEERMGHELNWYATIHENTDHWHAHVVIAGKIPERERELEQAREREYEIQRRGNGDRLLKWSSEEKDVRELLGDRYDERAETDPREDWRAEREFGHGSEREETDPRVAELLGDHTRSISELKTERVLDRYERQMEAREIAKSRGDVYLDVNDLRELRSAGNDYVHRERSFDRELERAFEREFGREYEHDMDRGRDRGDDLDRGRDIESMRWSEVASMFETDRFMQQEHGREYGHDEREDGPSRGEGRSRGGDDEERGRDDDMDRGRGWGR